VKLYEFSIIPRAFFGTHMKGDTLFGQFCWQVKYDESILNGGLNHWLNQYDTRPFAVFSSAWPKIEAAEKGYALKRPDLPLSWLFPREEDEAQFHDKRKENEEKRWMIVREDLVINLSEGKFLSEKDLGPMITPSQKGIEKRRLNHRMTEKIVSEFLQLHNTINRETMTTGEGSFAPYTKHNFAYFPGLRLAIFVLIDEEATDPERVLKALKRIGTFGFGRDASTGLGRFDVEGWKEIKRPDHSEANACYALGPVVPEKHMYDEVYFSPFVRFGRHGDVLAVSSNPFKAPVVMADEGAVLMPKDKNMFDKPYIGRVIRNISKIESNAVSQGYTVYLPFLMERKP